MGSLKELNSDKTVHLLLSDSSSVEMYVYDTLKATCSATLESIYEVKSQSDFKQMLELVSMQPYLASKWLFVVYYSKIRSLCLKSSGVFKSETSMFLVKVKNYKEYKEFKEKVADCNDLYLPVIRRNDVSFLLNKYELSSKVFNFICSTYARDPEKVFDLQKKLEQGSTVETQRDVVKLIGTGSGSVNSLLFLLLADPPKTEKGLKRVLKKRIQLALDLSNAFSTTTFKNFITAAAKDVLDIKVLYMQGIVFNTLKSIPEIEVENKKVYNEAKLQKYSFYLSSIEEEIPYTRILRLYTILSKEGMWKKDSDVLSFMYKYYGGVVG